MKQVRPKHTTIYRGARVHVRLIDGTEFDARFRERKAKYVMFEDRDSVKRADIVTFQPASWRKRNPRHVGREEPNAATD